MLSSSEVSTETCAACNPNPDQTQALPPYKLKLKGDPVTNTADPYIGLDGRCWWSGDCTISAMGGALKDCRRGPRCQEDSAQIINVGFYSQLDRSVFSVFSCEAKKSHQSCKAPHHDNQQETHASFWQVQSWVGFCPQRQEVSVM